MGPLVGFRVIDMTSMLMGPYATQMLGDFGADVIKVESPDGDLIRQLGPQRHAGMGAVFLNTNRSKRSITLDLKVPEGRDVLLRLCERADVLAYNVRPQTMQRLGLSYEQVAAANPSIIYAGMSGYGQDGPYAARPAYDDLIQGAAALPYLMSRASGGKPRYVPSAIADRIVGLFAANAILTSLLERERSGRGQRVDVAMFEAMAGFVLSDHLQGLTFEPPIGPGGYARLLSPERRPYRTQDGYVCVLIYNDGHWRRFFAAIGRSELPDADPRYGDYATRMGHVDEIYEELGRIFETRTTSAWLALLEAADVPAMPMHDLDSLLEDPHLKATGFFEKVEHLSEGLIRSMAAPVKWSRTPAAPERLAPGQGADGEAILEEAGFTSGEIADLVGQGVVGGPGRDA